MTNDNIEFYREWIDVNDYEIKLLLAVSVLAYNNLAYRGTIKELCYWINVKPHTDTYKKVNKALQNLEQRKYIYHIVEGRIHHISISEKGLKDKRVISIKKVWIEEIKQYKQNINDVAYGVDWGKMIKFFVYCLIDNGEVKTMDERKKELGFSSDTIRRCFRIISLLQFDDLHFFMKTVKTIVNDEYWITKGTSIVCMKSFTNTNNQNSNVAVSYWFDEDEYELIT